MNRSAPATEDRIASQPHDRAFFGHPAGLLTLFFAEMWERFSYYGMRAILMLFMTALTVEQAQELISSGQEVAPGDVGGLGFPKAQAGVIYAFYTSLVYFAGLAGGWLADNVIGQRRAVFWGGVVIMFGHISLAFHGLPFFFSGLALIILGTGLLKPNISTIVGQLYAPKDVRRDSGFALYYLGINLGSLLGQFACGFFAQHHWFKEHVLLPMGIAPTASWHWGFAAAAVGMFFGLVVYVARGNLMGEAGLRPNSPGNEVEAQRRKIIVWALIGGVILLAIAGLVAFQAGIKIDADYVNLGFGIVLVIVTLVGFGHIFLSPEFTPDERQRLTVVCILFFASVLFWGAFEQAGSSLTLFANEKSQLELGLVDIPSSWYQNVNPFGIIVLSPFFAWMWLRLGERAPSSPAKFSLGLILVGLGFVVVALGSKLYDGSHARISPLWLTSGYLLHTLGELCLSPIGLSMVTKLAPQRTVSQIMSIWFLANADGNFIASQTVVINDKFKLSDTQIFAGVAAITIAAGIVLAVMVPRIKKMMGGVK